MHTPDLVVKPSSSRGKSCKVTTCFCLFPPSPPSAQSAAVPIFTRAMTQKDFQPVVCYSKRLVSQQSGNLHQQAIPFNCYSIRQQAKLVEHFFCSAQQLLRAKGQPVLEAELTWESELIGRSCRDQTTQTHPRFKQSLDSGVLISAFCLAMP